MTKKKHFRVFVPKIIIGILLAVAIGYVIKVIVTLINEKPSKAEKKIQPIMLMKPPPPPPPPPKTEPPPEPEVKQKIEEPTPEPESKPEPEPLPDVPDEPAGDTGLDAEGTAGSDPYGLQGKPGGKGLFGGGGGASPQARYAASVGRSLSEFLSEYDEIKHKSYYAVVNIWLNPDGSVARFELTRGSNDPDLDKLLNKLLAKFKKTDEPPPVGVGHVELKIKNRL
ncbi:MAG: TonB C-terminal domain-containing protein [Methylococcaceae bacterium]|jgi:protein TonB